MAAIHLAQKSKAKALETYRQAVRHPFLGTEHRSRVMRVFLHFLTYHLTRTEWTPFSGVPEYARRHRPSHSQCAVGTCMRPVTQWRRRCCWHG